MHLMLGARVPAARTSTPCTWPAQVGNPLYNEHRDNNTMAEYRVEVRSRGRRRMRSCVARGARRSSCGGRHAPAPHALPTCGAIVPPTLPPCPRQVLKRLPNLKKLDGIPVDVDERDQALQARGGT